LLLARFKDTIVATPEGGDRMSVNHGFVDAVAQTHAKQTVGLVRARSPALAVLEAEGKIKIIGAMYDIERGQLVLV
jgi:carbonic anhydrase